MKNWVYMFFIISSVGFAQKEANIWYFGENAGLDFNSGSPIALTDGKLWTNEGCSAISDKDGNLLFYTDGVFVYNRNHEIMLNGTDLFGHESSTQSAIIVPKPNDENIYYVFTTDYQWSFRGLRYTEIDMSLDGGVGAVTTNKNILLEEFVSEKVSAVVHANGTDIWVVTHGWGNDSFYSFLVSSTGVNTTPITSNAGPVITGALDNRIGVLKISPKADKLVICSDNLGSQLFDFNNITGEVSNPVELSNRPFDYGAEFSPSGKVLYISTLSAIELYQYNLNSADIKNSEAIISNTFARQLQLGPDQKIYVAKAPSNYLGVINFPNNLGAACDFVEEAVFLEGKRSLAGLPQFIQSYFNIGAFDHDNTCFGDTTTFKLDETVDAVLWDFGDPVSGSNNTSSDFEPTHVFTVPGTYTVTVTATVDGETDTIEQDVTIHELPTATKPQDILACDGDNDGLYNFDLSQQDAAILNGLDATVFEVKYYASGADYSNDVPVPNPEHYINKGAYAQETVIAAVHNRNNPACDDITSFRIQVFNSPMPGQNIPKLSFCDNTSLGTDHDGKIQFDLTQNQSGILNGQPLADFEVKYYTDASFLNEIATPNSYENSNIKETVYVKVTNKINPRCSASTQFEIEVLELPMEPTNVTLQQCDDDLDGFSDFNLNEVMGKLTSNPSDETVSFFESQADAENNSNAISNLTTYRNETVSTAAIWARVENGHGCFRTARVDLIVTSSQVPDTFTRDFYVCDDLDGNPNNGISDFDFSSVQNDVLALFPTGQQLDISYYENEDEALSETNPIADISNYRNVDSPFFKNIYVRVENRLNNDCLSLGGHINLYVEPLPMVHPVTIERQCDDDHDGRYPFDVSQIEAQVLNGQSLGHVTVSYFDENNNPLPSPLPNPFLTASQTITIRVSNNNITDGSCYAQTELEFIVDDRAIANPVSPQIACDDGFDDADGFHDFDTSSIESTILNGQTGMEVHYFNEHGEALSSPLPNPFFSNTQTIRAEVVNPKNNNCTASTDIEFIVNPLPEFSIDTPQIVCSSDPTFTVVLDPLEHNTNEALSYQWVYEDGTVLSNTPTLTVSTPGTYSVTLSKTDGTGCSRTRDIFVNASELASITQDDIEVFDVSNHNTITVETANLGLGDYEFALNDEYGNYQDEPYFADVPSGVHTVYVRDKKGCGVSAIEVSVVGFPKYFTPNGDGINDYWQIDGANSQLQAKSAIYIYNRYGKLLKQLAATSKGWDGTVNGKRQTSDDYWFRVLLEDGREFKGHFALKR